MRDSQATLRWLLASDPEAVRAELVELLSTIQDELLGPSQPNLGELQRIEAAASPRRPARPTQSGSSRSSHPA